MFDAGFIVEEKQVKRRLIIFDTTLREGEQAPGCAMLPHEKLAVAELLEKLNVDVIEAGFAASSQGDFLAIQAVAAKIRKPIISSLCRARREDIDAAALALKDARQGRIHIVLAMSDLHLEHKLNISRARALEWATGSVKYARNLSSDVQFTVEDASRTDRNFLIKAINAVIDAGASTVNLADTVGRLMPEEFGELIRFVREKAEQINRALLSVHVHDDLGLALASTLAALQAGADQAECTINGIGDRAGICALEEIVYALKMRQDYFFSLRTDIHEEFLVPTSRLVAQYTGTRIPHFKSVVGSRARKAASFV
ncbi:MAG: hypothetical protein HQL19_05005 [Candidatus Omnitrophica bacterium]|nr:hypothetical protein [Candidatus Omnitrophota bacterium]